LKNEIKIDPTNYNIADAYVGEQSAAEDIDDVYVKVNNNLNDQLKEKCLFLNFNFRRRI
jgi:hypothetical protein